MTFCLPAGSCPTEMKEVSEVKEEVSEERMKGGGLLVPVALVLDQQAVVMSRPGHFPQAKDHFESCWIVQKEEKKIYIEREMRREERDEKK